MSFATSTLAQPIIETVAGNGQTGFNGDGRHALSTSFRQALGIYFDSQSNLIIADMSNHRVRRIDAVSRIVSTIAGNGVRTGSIDGEGGDPVDDLGDGRLATEASLFNPAVAAWAMDGALFVGDRENRRLRMVDPDTGRIGTIAGTGIPGPTPDGVAGTSTDIYPTDLEVDEFDNPVVLDSWGDRVAVLDRDSGIINRLSDAGLAHPNSVTSNFAQDSAGNFYFTDSRLHVVYRITPTGDFSIIAGSFGNAGFSGDGGPAFAALLSHPGAIVLAADRYLFVADFLRIRLIDLQTGIIDTLAGTGVQPHTIDGEGGDPSDDLGDGGPASQASLYPVNLEMGPDRALYVNSFNLVRRITNLCLPGFNSVVRLSLNVTTVWPPNHQMIDINAQVTDCTGPVPATLISVTSSEADDAPGGGDGHTTDDIQGVEAGTADLSFQVRAERDGGGPGREYIVKYLAGDPASVQTATILIPRNRHDIESLAEMSVRETPNGTLLRWAPVPGALGYTVARGDAGSLRATGASLDLGRLDCVASGIPGESVQDTVEPDPGSAFFYLVGYDDGWTQSDGTERLTMRPVRYTGGCP